jgi:hypothetical protein
VPLPRVDGHGEEAVRRDERPAVGRPDERRLALRVERGVVARPGRRRDDLDAEGKLPVGRSRGVEGLEGGPLAVAERGLGLDRDEQASRAEGQPQLPKRPPLEQSSPGVLGVLAQPAIRLALSVRGCSQTIVGFS